MQNWQQQINNKSLKPCYELSQVQYQNDRNTTVCQKIVWAKCVSTNRLKIQTCKISQQKPLSHACKISQQKPLSHACKITEKNPPNTRKYTEKALLKTIITTSCSI